jgi:hypothetical protein
MSIKDSPKSPNLREFENAFVKENIKNTITSGLTDLAMLVEDSDIYDTLMDIEKKILLEVEKHLESLYQL